MKDKNHGLPAVRHMRRWHVLLQHGLWYNKNVIKAAHMTYALQPETRLVRTHTLY